MPVADGACIRPPPQNDIIGIIADMASAPADERTFRWRGVGA